MSNRKIPESVMARLPVYLHFLKSFPAQEGDTILLSPACTSWDMYPSYKARGEDFCRVVEEIIESEG